MINRPPKPPGRKFADAVKKSKVTKAEEGFGSPIVKKAVEIVGTTDKIGKFAKRVLGK